MEKAGVMRGVTELHMEAAKVQGKLGKLEKELTKLEKAAREAGSR